MVKKQNNPHDKFFKELFSRKAEVESFIKGFLDKKIVENIDFESLELENNSYVDEILKESFADIVYNCKYSGKKIKITILFEHKTRQDNAIYLQLMRYMLNIWQTYDKQKKKLTSNFIPVLPIVVYHGSEKWNYKAFAEYFEDLPSELLPFIPNFSYLIKDLSIVSSEKLVETYNSVILQSGLLVMKNIFDTLALFRNLYTIFSNLQQIDNVKYISTVFYYLYYTKEYKDFVKLKEQVEQHPKIDNNMITIAEGLIQEGRQEEAERNACALLVEGLSFEFIHKITKVSLERIAELKQYIDENGTGFLNEELSKV